MPTPLMKSFAKQTHKKSKTVEKLWKKSEKLVKKKYDIDEESDRFYPLVVGVLKHVLGLSKEEFNEDESGADNGGEITTTNMGDYVYATPMALMTRIYPKFPNKKTALENKSRKFNSEQYDKYVRQIVKNINESEMDADDIFSDVIEHYCTHEMTPEDIVDYTIEAVGKYYGVVPSLFDDLK